MVKCFQKIDTKIKVTGRWGRKKVVFSSIREDGVLTGAEKGKKSLNFGPRSLT